MKHLILATTALTMSIAVISAPAFASEETELLRKQIKLLEARIDELERREKQRNTAARAPEEGNKNIESRLTIVERKQELAEDDIKTKAEKNAAVEVGKGKGLTVTSADKQYSFRVGAYAQADTRTFFDNSNTSNVDTFLIRTARPYFEAKITDYFTARMVVDFGSGSTRLVDAHLDGKFIPQLNARLGKFKAPVGLERWQSETEIMFVERGMTTNLVSNRDIGIMAMGELIPNQLEYQLAFTNGTADLGDSNADTDDNKEISGRIFTHPFRLADTPTLAGLGIGIAGSYGDRKGNSTTSNLTDGYRTPGQARFYTFTTGAFADGAAWRVNPQAYYYNGPFGALGEYVISSQEVTRNASHATLKNDAWMIATSYVLTGEDASFSGLIPEKDFNPRQGTWGAFEVLARYGVLNVDGKAFPTYASLATAAKTARESTLGVNWHFNPSIKLNLNYSWTTFDGGATGSLDREDEKALISRVQFKF